MKKTIYLINNNHKDLSGFLKDLKDDNKKDDKI